MSLDAISTPPAMRRIVERDLKLAAVVACYPAPAQQGKIVGGVLNPNRNHVADLAFRGQGGRENIVKDTHLQGIAPCRDGQGDHDTSRDCLGGGTQ